ncbi:hypothetical protein [Roseiarcus fermentans]|nr:hypothetical protein [Roseiarcus fermentans]
MTMALASSPTRRSALAIAAALACALAACDAPKPAAVQPEARPAVKIAAVTVDTSALAALNASPVAAWVQSALPGRIAHAFEAEMAPGDPGGATLAVRISSVVLGMVGAGGGAIDGMTGEATLSGGGAEAKTASLTATLPYTASKADLSLGQLEQPALERRVDALARAFADWLPVKLAAGASSE